MSTKNGIFKQFRQSLASIDALPQLTLIGLIVGFLAGGLIVIFRLLIEVPLAYILPTHIENFEGLHQSLHFLLPVSGGIIIAIAFYYIPKKYHDVSIGNVLERVHNFQGRMAFGNLVVQFFGAALCLISGQSVGREGPAVHIGASAASLFGQWIKLPHNSLRILAGCGVAAAIAASFNTPVAGVIFAMEVVLMSYSIVGFIPVMMASVAGTFLTRVFFGNEFLFNVTIFEMHGLFELAFMAVAGCIIGMFATLYMRLQLGFHRFSHFPISGRVIVASIVTGSLALITPEILGLGYDTVNLALEGKLALGTLALILLTKIIATSFSISMGMPGGLIGPQLFIGACIGAIMGNLINLLFPDSVSHSGFYVLLGMAAMMGAVINAPLAALMAVLELTYNPELIFPSMLIIVMACLTTRLLFKCEGIFVEQLAKNKKYLASSPTQQILNNISVQSCMKTAFVECRNTLSAKQATQLLSNNPLWIIINTEDEKLLLRAADLANHLNQDHLDEIDLLEIPGERLNLLPINELATLYEAQQLLKDRQSDALYVTPQIQDTPKPVILGIITNTTISNHYTL